MIQANETEEFLSYWEIYKERVEEIRGKIDNYISEIQKDWKKLYGLFGPDFKSRKEFAEVAKKSINSGAMFKSLDMFMRGEKDIEKFITKYVMEMMSDRLADAIEV